MSTPFKTSVATLIQRVPRSDAHPYACAVADNVPIDVPAVVAFGGELTRTMRGANSYANLLQRVAEENEVATGVNFYSVMYDFGSRMPALERTEQFRIAGRKIREQIHPLLKKERDDLIREMKEHEPVANYVVQLYDILLRPRIVVSHDMPTNIEQTIKNIHQIVFYGHCHGASVIWQMGEYMHNQMIQTGFAPRDVSRIQKELLVIQHSPIAPLDKQRFTTLSFASAEDTMMQHHHNLFAQWSADNSADVMASYFPRGNLFMAGRLKEMSFQEHDHSGLLFSDELSWPLTDDGRLIFSAERNALVHGIENMIAGNKKLPSVKKLVHGPDVDFERLCRNGDFLSKIMMQDLRQQNPKRDYQK